jgi:hypothetical protein
LSKRTKSFLNEQKIELVKGKDFQGRRADYEKYVLIDLTGLVSVSENYDENGNIRLKEVTAKIKEKFEIDNELTDYIIRTQIFPDVSKARYEKIKTDLGV